MNLHQTIELTMTLDTEKFQKLFKRAYGKKYSDEKECIHYSLASQGITVAYRDSQYKKKVRLTVDPRWVLDGEDLDLTKVVIATDINVQSREKVTDYLKVLQRIGRVKGFSPSSNNDYGEDVCFWLEGNSNGIQFLIYNLEEVLEAELKETDGQRKKLKSAIEQAKGVLRVEVQLTKALAIRTYTENIKTEKQISDLSKKSEEVFMDTFVKIIPFGDFYKKGKAVEMIRREVHDEKLRRRMLHLLELVPEKKSLLLAQKALNYRRLDELMDMFASLDLSPVTLSKRHDVKKLDNLYKYI